MKNTFKIAIVGTRGVPNAYGGFEQFAEYLSKGLAAKGHQVYVYNSHNHPYQEKMWEGVHIIHQYDAEVKMGTAGQFIYDFNCILDARKHQFDIILQLGYTSSSIWSWLFPKKSVLVTNMDGLEWKRTKYSRKVQIFLTYAEKWGAMYGGHLVADSIGIQTYLKEKYGKPSTYLPYGAHPFLNPQEDILEQYGVKPREYDMLIARMEPENNIETILDGVVEANNGRTFMVVGGHTNHFGEYLKKKFGAYKHIKFVGGIYNINHLNNLRWFTNLYFHGHSVGGTNPSLLEAMASGALMCAHENPFNKHILGPDAFYFTEKSQVAKLLNQNINEQQRNTLTQNNMEKIAKIYNWEKIINDYEALFLSLV